MSTLKVGTIADTSGSNGSTPAAIANGIAKAWVNFNGTGTVAIRASYNVSSITDNGTGDYTVNFTNAMVDANYSITAGNSRTNVSGANVIASIDPSNLPTTSGVRLNVFNYANTPADPAIVTVSIFR